jgi:hypothetical protein
MIQITISKEDNPKVAGFLMDNGIEYKSEPVDTIPAVTVPVMGESTEFLEYVKEARDEFSMYINSREWNSKLRTECESLLTCFDQMKERLSLQPDTTPVPDGNVRGYEWQKIFYERMEANGYKRAEYIPEIADSVDEFQKILDSTEPPKQP